eukprot:4528446-Pleurochrysis_carterae.AAC.1
MQGEAQCAARGNAKPAVEKRTRFFIPNDDLSDDDVENNEDGTAGHKLVSHWTSIRQRRTRAPPTPTSAMFRFRVPSRTRSGSLTQRCHFRCLFRRAFRLLV